MIRINLAQRKQTGYATAKSSGDLTSGGSHSSLSSFKGIFSGGAAGDLASTILKVFVPLILSALIYYGFNYYTEEKKAEMQREVTTIVQEKSRVDSELQKLKRYDAIKIELERNEISIRNKIQTIEKLIRGRDFTVKSLVVLSQALPKEVWLTEIVTTEQGFNFKGGTSDIGLVSDLMSKLGQTIYFKDVTLKSTSTNASQKQASFELTARRE